MIIAFKHKSFKSLVSHGTEYPRTRRVTIGACMSAAAKNQSLMACQLPSIVSQSLMISHGMQANSSRSNNEIFCL